MALTKSTQHQSPPQVAFVLVSTDPNGEVVVGITLFPSVADEWEQSAPRADGLGSHSDESRQTRRFHLSTSVEEVERSLLEQDALDRAQAIRSDILSCGPEAREALKELGILVDNGSASISD